MRIYSVTPEIPSPSYSLLCRPPPNPSTPCTVPEHPPLLLAPQAPGWLRHRFINPRSHSLASCRESALPTGPSPRCPCGWAPVPVEPPALAAPAAFTLPGALPGCRRLWLAVANSICLHSVVGTSPVPTWCQSVSRNLRTRANLCIPVLEGNKNCNVIALVPTADYPPVENEEVKAD